MYQELNDEDLEFLLPLSFKRRGSKLPRRQSQLPRLSGARIEHGIPIEKGDILKLVFEEANSDWLQSVHLETDRNVTVDSIVYRKGVIIPFDGEGKEHIISCRTKEGMLWVWNLWEYRGNQGEWLRLSHVNYCGMLVEELPNGYRYRCNEGLDDDDYDDLVFRIERTRL